MPCLVTVMAQFSSISFWTCNLRDFIQVRSLRIVMQMKAPNKKLASKLCIHFFVQYQYWTFLVPLFDHYFVALIVVFQEPSGSSLWRWRSRVPCRHSSRRCWRTQRAKMARAAAVAAAAPAPAAVALQLRRGQAPAVRAAPTRTPLLLSRQSLWTQKGQRPHHLTTTSPRRRLQVPLKLSLTFLCTKKGTVGQGTTPTPHP